MAKKVDGGNNLYSPSHSLFALIQILRGELYRSYKLRENIYKRSVIVLRFLVRFEAKNFMHWYCGGYKHMFNAVITFL